MKLASLSRWGRPFAWVAVVLMCGLTTRAYGAVERSFTVLDASSVKVTVSWNFGASVPDSSLLLGETITSAATGSGPSVSVDRVGTALEGVRTEGNEWFFLVSREALRNPSSISYVVSGLDASSMMVRGTARHMTAGGLLASEAIQGATAPGSAGGGEGGSSEPGLEMTSLTILGFSVENRAEKTLACFKWSGSGDKPVKIQWKPSLSAPASTVRATASSSWTTIAVFDPATADAAVKPAAGRAPLALAPASEPVHSYSVETTASSGFFRLAVEEPAEEK